jgi:3-deoxy-D-manno-octulosonic-acid transferase
MVAIYRYLTFFLFPLFIILIYLRSIFNKEHQSRYKEKIFSSSFNVVRNYKKKLFWFHATSIGELLSILPLIDEINNINNNIEFLITTTTLSSSNLLGKKKIEYNIIHRFFPLDTERLSGSFLEKWKPDLVCFVDSEIWPNFLFKIKEKKIPLVLINGRITKKTFKKWILLRNFAKKVFNNFDLCLACSEESKNNLEKIEVKNLSYIGNLKFAVKIRREKIDKLNKKILENFKPWCAASTHQGEEFILLKTHNEIKKKHNNVLTIIIPRHINRIKKIKKLTENFKLRSQILDDGDLINTSIEVLIINSFGVLNKYFDCCKNVFIGKSLVKKLEKSGGQNPIEAAKIGCKIYYGPYVYNFDEVYNFLKINNISEQINNEYDLSKKIIENFDNTKIINEQNISMLNNHGTRILKQTISELNKLIKI